MGKNKLDRAIATHKTKYPGDTFHTTWHPYMLDPSAPKTGTDKRQEEATRHGPERAAMIMQRLQAAGKELGINFSFGGKTGNTRDSHRVIEMAGRKGEEVQNKVVKELFVAYFEKEQDITSHEMLKAVAVKAGLGDSEVAGWLEGDDGGDAVDKAVMKARMQGISGVPNYTLQGKYEIGGAQDTEAFVRAFEQIKAREGS